VQRAAYYSPPYGKSTLEVSLRGFTLQTDQLSGLHSAADGRHPAMQLVPPKVKQQSGVRKARSTLRNQHPSEHPDAALRILRLDDYGAGHPDDHITA